MKMSTFAVCALLVVAGHAMNLKMSPEGAGLLQLPTASFLAMGSAGACKSSMSKQECAMSIAGEIVSKSRDCFAKNSADEGSYKTCVQGFCGQQCGKKGGECKNLCVNHANPLFARLSSAEAKAEAQAVSAVAGVAPANSDDTAHMNKAQLQQRSKDAEKEQADAMQELQSAQQRMVNLNDKIKARAETEIKNGNKARGEEEMAKVAQIAKVQDQISGHLANVQAFSTVAVKELHQSGMGLVQKSKTATSFLQIKAPEDELAKEMTHDLEMNFNKIAPFGKEDTAKELQDHAAKTQDTLVDAVENAEVAEIKRAVFRALTRLRAATIKEFDTIARLETQAIDAYNDAHHYRAENPLAHLHEDEAPVETDKLKSFH